MKPLPQFSQSQREAIDPIMRLPLPSINILLLDLQIFDAIWLCDDLFSRVKICNSLIFQVICWKGLKLYTSHFYLSLPGCAFTQGLAVRVNHFTVADTAALQKLTESRAIAEDAVALVRKRVMAQIDVSPIKTTLG